MMHRKPSNSEIQRLVLDLCRAAVTLRIAETRGVLSGDGESGRLADSIDHWLTVCESQITPILEPSPDIAPDNVIDLASKRAGRDIRPPPPVAEMSAITPVKSLGEKHWAELRDQLRKISSTMQNI